MAVLRAAFAALLLAPALAAADAQPTRGLGEIALAPAQAEAPRRRIGVVVGNGAYAAASPLNNAVADARAMAALLRSHGFALHEGYDLDKRGFERLLRAVLADVEDGAEVVFFYAGHGIQIGRRNYLLPVDAHLQDPVDVPFETISLDRVIAVLSARSKLQLLLLDSCRENPFVGARMLTELDAQLFETREGFDAMGAPLNTLLSYSTSPGQLALDGPPGEGSPYARALIETVAAAPERDVIDVLGAVRRAVWRLTDGRQVPWESSTLVEPFAFLAAAEAHRSAPAPGPEAAEAEAVAEATPAPQPAPDAGDMLRALDGRTVAVAAPLERRTPLGPALAGALGRLPEGTLAALAAPPAQGRLALAAMVVSEATGAVPADLDALAYEWPAPPADPGPDPRAHDVADRLTLRLSLGDAQADVTVALDLAMDPCDWRAGDQFDPQGLGVSRLPNQLEPELALADCDAAVARAPDVGRLHYQRGRALRALRRTDDAMAAFETAASLGHARGWAAAGALMDLQGWAAQGAEEGPAPPEALALMARAADAGDPYGKHLLGRKLLRFGETEQDRRRGFDLLGEAVEVGHTFAMNELGFYFISPDAPHSQPERGLRYLHESAAREDIYGYNNLGIAHLRGLGGVEQDDALAADWFERAALGGHPFAPGNLGRMLARGVAGGPADDAAAVRWNDMGLERGDAWAGANAAWIIVNRDVPGLGPADAAARAAKAAALRDVEAAEAAARLLADLPPEALDRAAQAMLAALGEPIAVDGRFGPQSRAALARRAADAGAPARMATAQERALTAARIHWLANPFRPDMF